MNELRAIAQEHEGADIPTYRQMSYKQVKASKDHFCTLCSKPIKSGELYTRQVANIDGDFITDKRHFEPGRCFTNLTNEKEINFSNSGSIELLDESGSTSTNFIK